MAARDYGRPLPEDLTARARIRDAALKHFAELGFTKATIRGIAETAGVSPGLVRHHFGSKEALREACDGYVLQAFRRFNEQALAKAHAGDLGTIATARMALRPFQRYVAHALLDGSTAMASLFDEMVKMTEPWLADLDQSRTDRPVADQRTRAALITAMAMGIPLLHEHVSRAIGVDMFAEEGDRQIALALLDIYSHNLVSPELADSARAGWDESGREPPSM